MANKKLNQLVVYCLKFCRSCSSTELKKWILKLFFNIYAIPDLKTVVCPKILLNISNKFYFCKTVKLNYILRINYFILTFKKICIYSSNT